MSYPSSYSVSPAKVYFNAGFDSHAGRDHAGRRLDVQCSFIWDGMPCYIPAVYVCAGGVVLDVLIRIDLARIGAFSERWTGRAVNRELSMDERLRMEADDPFSDTLTCRLIANGKALIPQRREYTVFNPCPDCAPVSTPQADELLEGYGCDMRYGWYIVRTSFGWATRKKPALHSLSLTLERCAQLLPGVHFTVRYPGQHFFFANPVTGTEHKLTILGCARENGADGERLHLSCTLSPELSTRELCIRDSAGALPTTADFDDGSLRRRDASEQQYLHDAFSQPCTGADDNTDWQLFFLQRNAAPISVVLMDEQHPVTNA